jgi:hypothetical protein
LCKYAIVSLTPRPDEENRRTPVAAALHAAVLAPPLASRLACETPRTSPLHAPQSLEHRRDRRSSPVPRCRRGGARPRRPNWPPLAAPRHLPLRPKLLEDPRTPRGTALPRSPPAVDVETRKDLAAAPWTPSVKPVHRTPPPCL